MPFPIQLVRLYMRWQGDAADTAETEAEAFQQWLQAEHKAIAAQISMADILQLVRAQRERSSAVTAGRRENRVQENIQVMINVDGKNGASRAQTEDTGVHGMKLKSDINLPGDAEFQMTVALSGFPITIFNLEGQARWVAQTSGGYAVGVEVKESRDFYKWKKRFSDADDQDQSASGDS